MTMSAPVDSHNVSIEAFLLATDWQLILITLNGISLRCSLLMWIDCGPSVSFRRLGCKSCSTIGGNYLVQWQKVGRS